VIAFGMRIAPWHYTEIPGWCYCRDPTGRGPRLLVDGGRGNPKESALRARLWEVHYRPPGGATKLRPPSPATSTETKPFLFRRYNHCDDSQFRALTFRRFQPTTSS
jgi:hypothetical protein